jgi:hypothetical protein
LDGAGEFEASELPDPLDPLTLAQGGNWVLQTRLGRFDLMQWIGENELWDMLSPSAVEVELEGILERLRQARGIDRHPPSSRSLRSNRHRGRGSERANSLAATATAK